MSEIKTTLQKFETRVSFVTKNKLSVRVGFNPVSVKWSDLDHELDSLRISNDLVEVFPDGFSDVPVLKKDDDVELELKVFETKHHDMEIVSVRKVVRE